MPKRGGRKGQKKVDRYTPALGPPTDGRAITVPRSAQQVRRWTIRGSDTITVGVSGITTWAVTSTNAQQFCVYWMARSPLWTDIAQMVDEYHMDTIRVRGLPLQKFNRLAGQTVGTGAICFDNDGLVGTNATSVDQVLSYSTARVIDFAEEWEIQWSIPPASTGVWYDANGAANVTTAQLCELAFQTDTEQTASIGSIQTVYWEIGVTTRGTRQ